MQIENRVFPKVPETVSRDLIRIGGTNDYGQPKLQLVWGEERIWFRAGIWRLKYPTKRKRRVIVGYNVIDTLTGEKYFTEKGPPKSVTLLVSPVEETQDIGYKGWVLEEWWPPELVCLNWEKNRWWNAPDGKRVDLLGEEPTRGDYRFLMYCEDEKGQPMSITDHRMIAIIERAIRLREDTGAPDGWRALQSPEKAEKLYRRIAAGREEEKEQLDSEMEEFITDQVKGYARRMRHAYLS